MKTWKDLGFQREITRDGSISLRAAGGDGEMMHHSAGALEETSLIYGEPLSEIFQSLERPRIFSLGLGMGYVEFVTAAQALRWQKGFEILTMESEASLIAVMDDFLSERPPEGEIGEDLSAVLKGVADWAGVSTEALWKTLATARRGNDWRIAGALDLSSIPEGRFHGVMYDAFSSQTSPQLWTEDFLNRFFSSVTADDSMVSTYACTGNLKRALKNQGFTLSERPGFQGKRSATLARKGLFRNT